MVLLKSTYQAFYEDCTWKDKHMQLGSSGGQTLFRHVQEAEALGPRHDGLLGRGQADGGYA